MAEFHLRQTFDPQEDPQEEHRQGWDEIPAEEQRVGHRKHGEVYPGIGEHGPGFRLATQDLHTADDVQNGIQEQPGSDPPKAEGLVCQERRGVVLQQAHQAGFGRQEVGGGLGRDRMGDRIAVEPVTEGGPCEKGEREACDLPKRDAHGLVVEATGWKRLPQTFEHERAHEEQCVGARQETEACQERSRFWASRDKHVQCSRHESDEDTGLHASDSEGDREGRHGPHERCGHACAAAAEAFGQPYEQPARDPIGKRVEQPRDHREGSLGPTTHRSQTCEDQGVQRGSRAQHGFAGVVYQPCTPEHVASIAEGDVGIVHDAGPGDETGSEHKQNDEDLDVDSELSHARIIQASKEGGKPAGRSLPWGWTVLGVALLALALKIVLLALDAFPFNADEAIVGLMARHILQGRWPVFFYGQVYMGSLDATLVAGAFGVFGAKVIAIRAVQCLLYMGTVATTMILARQGLGSKQAAIAAGLLMAIPTVNTTLYSTVSLGGYGEVLLLGNLLLILSLSIRKRPERILPFFVWGLLAGLGFWTFGLSLVTILPAGILLLVSLWCSKRKRALSLAAVVAGILVGAGPWIWQALMEGFGPLVAELGGSAIAVESGGHLIWSRLSNALLFGSTVTLGLRPPWEVSWLALPLAPLALAFWVGVLIHTLSSLRSPDRSGQERELRWLLVGVAAVLFLGFLLTPFGGDPSGRYFVALAVPMAILGADFVERLRLRSGRRLVYGLLAVPLVFHLWGTFQALAESPTGLTTQFDSVTWIDRTYDDELIAFLEQKDESYGYSNYWVAYPLAFLSDERLIFVPRLPYHQDFRYTERDNRYSPYDAIVEASSQAAYITTHHPELDEHLRSAFVDLGVTWRETKIGDYQIYYALSEKVSPQEIGLGVDLP